MLKIWICAMIVMLSTPCWGAQLLTVAHVGGEGSVEHDAVTALIGALEHDPRSEFRLDERNGVQGADDRFLWNAVQNGRIDIAVIGAASLELIQPSLGVFQVPFLFHDDAQVNAVLEGRIGQRLGDQLNRFGVVFLGFADRGFRQWVTAHHKVERPSDLSDLHVPVEAQTVDEETFRLLGATLVTMDSDDAFSAEQKGDVDMVASSLTDFEAHPVTNHGQYLAVGNVSLSPMLIVINADRYRRLSPAERAALQDAVHRAQLAAQHATAMREAAILARLRGDDRHVTRLDREAFATALSPLQSVWEKRFGRHLLRSIRALRP